MRSVVAAALWLIGVQLSPSARLLEVLSMEGADGLTAATRLASEYPDLEAAQLAVVDFHLDSEEAPELLAQRPDDAYARFGLAQLAIRAGDLDRAVDELETSIALQPSFAEPYGLRSGLVGVYEAKRDLSAAIEYFARLASSDPSNANAHSGLGWSYARSFRFDDAVEAFSRALELEPDLTHAHHGLVQSYFRTGRYQRSWEAAERLRAAAQRRADFRATAYADMMMGTVSFFRGDYRTALERLGAARSLAERIGDTTRVASTVNNIAAVYASAGEHDNAREYFELSLDLARDSGSAQAAVNALGNVGTSLKKAGRYDEALARYREAVALARESGFRNQESITLANMAEAFELKGDRDDAARWYSDALAIAVSTENRTVEAFASGALGRLHRGRGEFSSAKAAFGRELEIGERTGEAEAQWEAHAGLGATHRAAGDREEAIRAYARAIAIYDEVRSSLAIESLGSGFLDGRDEPYDAIVKLLAAGGQFAEAFEYAEKFKAKRFLDILARGQTLFDAHLPEAIRIELDAARGELRSAHAERARATDIATIVRLDDRITELELRNASLSERVRAEHPEFFELATSEPMDPSRVRSLLRDDQVLVEYLVGEERISIFVVTARELRYREASVSRDELRAQVDALSPLFDGASGTRLFNAELADFSLPPARALYDTLLGPVEAWMPAGSELVIVPDDVLFYVPFEALVVDSADAEHRYDFDAATFVLERHAVSYSPSASLLDPATVPRRSADRGVLAFGNPPGLGRAPLPNATAELEAIGHAFADLDNELRFGSRATEAAFRDDAERYRVLHFATHFTADDAQPLYSQLLLAHDDALETYEIFDTRLNAELAVLSACNTARGPLRNGEGLIGISRAFRYAGVPSLVVSLWSVDDEATGRIMESFYRELRAGTSKTDALRRAKLDYLDHAPSHKKDPFFWAPFILNGDGSALSLPAEPPATAGWRLAFLVVAGIVAGFLVAKARRRERLSARAE